MNELLRNLVRLQALELGDVKDSDAESTIANLRKGIPPVVLAHYDRLMARGKKGIVPVLNQVCTGCHMRLPTGGLASLMHGDDIQLCDTCGRYLYLPEAAPVAAAAPAPPKRAKRKVKRKAALDPA